MAANPKEISTKPKLRLTKRSPKTEFDKLIDEAVQLTREIQQLSTPDAYRLTAKAFERELLEASGADVQTRARINKLQQDLDTNHAGLDHVRDALRQTMTFLRNKTWTQVPRDLRRFDFLTNHSNGAAVAELAKRELSTVDMVIVAARYVAKTSPAAFGTCDDSAAHKAKLAKLKGQQADLFERASAAYSRSDLEFGEVDHRTGASPVWFRRSDRKVPIHPPEDAVKRLVEHAVAQQGT